MGNYLIMLVPLVIIPISSLALKQYSQQFDVPRYPITRLRLATALLLYLSLAATALFWQWPGIHASWAFFTLSLFAVSLEANLKLRGAAFSLAPYTAPIVAMNMAIAAWVGLSYPSLPALLVWAVVMLALQGGSIAVLRRGPGAGSPATDMLVLAYVIGIIAVVLAPVILCFTRWHWLFDLELVLVSLSALLMGMGGSTYVVESTARELRGTRDRIAAEVEARTAELQAANKRLREVDRLKDQFLSTVSHELRTPLTAIKGYGEFLEDEIAGPLEGQQREFVTAIMAAA